ncbi:uncharacterized protein isoform X2 [Rhodnius prolixus]|uniref:uncharacterized protein isoform X2 n=1 Tax=Rhodnius prolixus TaxID=13249 RepID=UPI003D18B9F2
MGHMRKLHLFPSAVCLITPLTFIITYIVAVSLKHVNPIFPYISDTGTLSPESCVFTQLLNTTSILLACCVYIRHLQIQKQIELKWNLKHKLKLNRIATYCGYVSCLGLDIVGNFQVSNLKEVHYIGAVLCFIGGSIYFIFQTTFSFHLRKENATSAIFVIRFVLCIFCVILVITTLIPAVIASKQYRGVHSKKFWEPADGGYAWHVVSTTSEWMLAFTQSSLVLTFLPEFKTVTIRSPVLKNYVKIAVGINYLILASSGLNKYYVLTIKYALFQKLGEWTIITKNKHRNKNIYKHLAEKVITILNPSLYFFTSFALFIWISLPFIRGPETAVLLKLPNSWIPFLTLVEAHALGLLCTEVAYISQSLRQLKYESKHPSKFYENLVNCLQEHTKALGIFRDISIIYSEMFGFQVFISIISTCILIFGILKKEVMANAIIYILPNTFATTFEFYFLCWLSEQATQELQNIHWAAYDNNWYDAPVAIRRPLGIILEISKTPLYLKGANVINASLNTFVEAMKQGFSLYTALKVVTSDE